ncbi:MAG: MerR family transcriptional regulator [Thermodesulfobacteriota bacterium]|nr:MerR family transcriptional regulator [Thermodesulfobacteriota bacterium]
MPQRYISLREIGRRLGIPASTIVYYKDRFGKYIPYVHGEGKRRKYPLEAVHIFKEIREMYDKNWSAEQIEQELGLRFHETRKKAPPSGQWEGGLFRESLYDSQDLVFALSGITEKMSGFLESQRFLQDEIKELKTEISLLKKEKERLEDRHLKKISALEEERNELRRKKVEMERYILQKIRSDNIHHDRPTSLFLDLPLVIRTGHGEYLGVTGKSKKNFTIKNLIGLIQKNAGPKKFINMHWERQGPAWSLKVSSRDGKNKEQSLVLFFEEKMTPKKNLVARLTRMTVDGKVAPATFLLGLFKEIRDSFNN